MKQDLTTISLQQRLTQDYVQLLSPYFKEGDFAINLTFHPKCFPNIDLRSADIHHFLRLSNRSLVGRKGRMLNSAFAFEWDAGQIALHCHMILENPVECTLPQPDRIPLLMNHWMGMKCSGDEKANLIKVVWDKPGWIEYIFEDIKINDASLVEPRKWTLNS